ncbi:ROK family protein [Virgibacillus halophilus]|uniref:ROK family protein n=1 Tax=Tigheibacillus halophilus TaxID=361280 RepID=A0ABU5C2Y1_9BACI|nr:ROK family protein [Virgibacillus halophilus]
MPDLLVSVSDCPDLLTIKKGNVKLSAQFNWKDIPFLELLRSKIDLPLYIDNELKLQALAEYNRGGNSKQENMVVISFGSGVGSALISKGEIYRGEDNFAGEIGHTIVDPLGAYCPCGNFGCLQTYIAEQFLLDEASKTKKLNSIDDLISVAKEGEKWASNILDKATTYAALTVNNVICLNNPDVVVLTGSLVVNHPEIREEVLRKCKDQIWSAAAETFRLDTTEMGSEGVVVGAALSVQRKYLKEINLDHEEFSV